MKFFHRALCLCLGAVLLLSLFAGCGEREKKKITVSEVTHSVFYAPQYVAINKGFFEEEGLELELINGQGADKVMTAVISGHVDIGFAGPEASIYIYNEGREDYAEVFAQVTQRDGSFLVGRQPEENFNWSSLKGRHVLPGRKGGVPYMAFEYVIRQNGLEPGTDVNLDDSVQFATMAAAFVAGTGDYVTIFEPTATEMEKQGQGYIVAAVGDEAGEIPYTAYFANKSYIQKNPDVIQSFVNALYKGQKWVMEHDSAEVAEALQPSFPDTDLDVLETVVERYRNIGAWSETPVMKEEAFDRLQTVMETAGELEQKAPYDIIINNSFAEKAVG
ncbi:MAG: ABC transporter substrate-binding protein [Oscillospiraceae bacterium]|nr:ABC transporter substrate-binding protein [Oscillospiraceae bacterium]MDY4191437.1 ABC transporter substrate-binding protein [Oscillospiraceae bacterium]